jgi:transcriptional regulator with XRE-family HTH domain
MWGTMTTSEAAARRRILGAFLRAQREGLRPAALGLPVGARRRTPGLRREEVAQLAGLSTTWYAWLEQGRDIAVSPQALARLAATLNLDRAGRTYLFALAARRDPVPEPEGAAEPPATLAACVHACTAAAYVLDRLWNVPLCNAAAAELFAGWLDQPGPHNLLRFVFFAPAARTLLPDWEGRARRVLAEFRADCAAHLEDPPVRALLAELREASPPFAALWRQQDVTARDGGGRSFRHPALGLIALQQTTFLVAGRTDLKLVMLTPGP